MYTASKNVCKKNVQKIWKKRNKEIFSNFSLDEKINKNIRIEFFASDLTINNNITSLFNYVNNKFNPIDIIINSAGVFMIKSIEKSTIDDFDNAMNLNVKLPFLLSKQFSKNMIKKKWGRVVMIGSSSSYSGFENGSIYCATKHSLLGLSRALNVELN